MSTTTPLTWSGPVQPETNVPRLQRLLWDVFSVTETRVAEEPDRVIEFRGQLTQPSEQAHTSISARFRDLGYTAFLARENNTDVIQAIHEIVVPKPAQMWINALLFVATVITTLMAGAIIADPGIGSLALFARHPELLLQGAPFGLTLLAILGVHEMGHYIAGRIHKAAVTLPYFIPVPPFGALPLATLGAFIQLRSPIQNRRALFDIGLSGPLAGLVVAIGAYVYGLTLARPILAGGGITLGRSLLTQWLIQIVQPQGAQPGYALAANPFMIAGWLGLFVTVINLLPIGQLDGGHVLYAAFGRRVSIVGVAMIVGLFAMGYFLSSPTWTLWAILGLFFGVRHAPPLDDVTPLDPVRTAIAIGTFIVFVLIFVPVPFR